MRFIAIAGILLVAATTAWSQQVKEPSTAVSNPVVTTVQQMEEHYAKNLVGAAEEMPADKYSYKPTPEQMTFGHLMMHVAAANNGICSAIAGEKREVKLSENDSKETLANAVKDSFTYCQQVLEKTDDSNLGRPVTMFGRSGTLGGALVHLAADWADHYSAAAMYLRLNNLLPPSAMKK
jgi:Tfp pilus assembly protein PilE